MHIRERTVSFGYHHLYKVLWSSFGHSPLKTMGISVVALARLPLPLPVYYFPGVVGNSCDSAPEMEGTRETHLLIYIYIR